MSGFQVLEKHGVEKNAFIPSFAKLSLFFLFVYVSSFTAIADAATYYVSPSGSGTTCSSGSPCTLATGLGKSLVGDDYLYLQDGTYTGTSLEVPWSGTSGHPITIKAQNDGQVIVDGQNARMPFSMDGKSYITVEGIVFRNSSGHTVNISNSHHITFRRVSASNAESSTNVHIFLVYVSENVLLEDCAGFGTGRKVYQIYASDYVTLRRCWSRIGASSYSYGSDYSGMFSFYHSNHGLTENCISTLDPTVGRTLSGFSVHSNTGPSANYNSFYGNISHDMKGWLYRLTTYLPNKVEITGNSFINNVGINGINGFTQRGDDNAIVKNMTLVDMSQTGHEISELSPSVSPHPGISANLKNSVYINPDTVFVQGVGGSSGNVTFTHSYNRSYGQTAWYAGAATQGTNESTLSSNPYSAGYATYGRGAYLMVPSVLQGQGESGADIGAEVIYRYVDGVITSTHLWPWPMEDRILAETGISVTYESGGGIWGGTWEATKDWNEIYGGSSDATPPAAPQGLLVQ